MRTGMQKKPLTYRREFFEVKVTTAEKKYFEYMATRYADGNISKFIVDRMCRDLYKIGECPTEKDKIKKWENKKAAELAHQDKITEQHKKIPWNPHAENVAIHTDFLSGETTTYYRVNPKKVVKVPGRHNRASVEKILGLSKPQTQKPKKTAAPKENEESYSFTIGQGKKISWNDLVTPLKSGEVVHLQVDEIIAAFFTFVSTTKNISQRTSDELKQAHAGLLNNGSYITSEIFHFLFLSTPPRHEFYEDGYQHGYLDDVRFSRAFKKYFSTYIEPLKAKLPKPKLSDIEIDLETNEILDEDIDGELILQILGKFKSRYKDFIDFVLQVGGPIMIFSNDSNGQHGMYCEWIVADKEAESMEIYILEKEIKAIKSGHEKEVITDDFKKKKLISTQLKKKVL